MTCTSHCEWTRHYLCHACKRAGLHRHASIYVSGTSPDAVSIVARYIACEEHARDAITDALVPLWDGRDLADDYAVFVFAVELSSKGRPVPGRVLFVARRRKEFVIQ